MLRKVETLMKSGEVSLTPEVDVVEKGQKRKVEGIDVVGQVEDVEDDDATVTTTVIEPSKKKQKKSKAEAEVKAAKPIDSEDDFFE
jgi:hypothetical protein